MGWLFGVGRTLNGYGSCSRTTTWPRKPPLPGGRRQDSAVLSDESENREDQIMRRCIVLLIVLLLLLVLRASSATAVILAPVDANSSSVMGKGPDWLVVTVHGFSGLSGPFREVLP